MALSTQLDITRVVSTTLCLPNASSSTETTLGTISTQLGTTTTSVVTSTLQTGLIGSVGLQGKSAYQTWLDNGNTGAEQDFLDSLVSSVAGPVGATGAQGIQGSVGATGQQGVKGDTGDTGPQGVQGVAGVQGIQGIQGVQGLTGDTGPSGHSPVITLEGDQLVIDGVTQSTHLTGPQGIQGNTGAKGDTGEQGVQGIKGDTGEQGIQGVQGDTGAIGATGPKGDKGDTGEQGVPGNDAVGGVGVLVVDFGAFPGSNTATVTSTVNGMGIGAIVAPSFTSASAVENHTIKDHLYLPIFVSLSGKNVVTDTVSVTAVSQHKIVGKFNINYIWKV